MRYLSEAEFAALIPDADALALVSNAFVRYGHDRRVTSRPALAVMVAEHRSPVLLPLKGAVSTSLGVAGALIGAQHGDYSFVVCDSRTGQLLGIVEQAVAIKRRTALTALVAARLGGAADAGRVAVVGAGQIAREVIRLLPLALPHVATIHVAARSAASALRLVASFDDAANRGLHAAESIGDAIRGAELVITATSSLAPFVGAGQLAPGATVCALGGGEEIAADVLQPGDRLLVDDPDYALSRGSLAAWVRNGQHERSDILGRIDADLGAVATGAMPGRTNPRQTVLAIVQGMALVDLVMAHEALRRADLHGVGQFIAVKPQSARDPAAATSSAATLIDAWRKSESSALRPEGSTP
ncbi:MAG: hypothetical protein AB7G13_24070 [Lautropia sp.]